MHNDIFIAWFFFSNIYGEQLLRLSHQCTYVESTSWECGLFYVKPTDTITQSSKLNGLIHMKATLLRMLPLLRRTTVNNNNNRLNVTPHRSYCHSTGNLFRTPTLFCAGNLFLAGRDPRLFGNPQIRPPGLWNPPGTVPTGYPWLFPNVWLHVYPERAGIPKLEGVCYSDLPETSASPTWVSAAVTGMFHVFWQSLYDLASNSH